MKLWRISFFLCVLFAISARTQELSQQDLFVRGQEGYHTYRIPSLLVTKKGTLLAFCEGRKNSASDTGDIDILSRRSTDGGKTWSAMKLVWDDAANTCPPGKMANATFSDSL